jgi:predicted cupin superfamily sugar epimerase
VPGDPPILSEEIGPGSAGSAADHSGPLDSDELAAAEALAAELDLELLPLEGGLFRRTFSGTGGTAILFMLIGDDFSAMHRLASDEIYFHHSGSPLRMLLIDPDGRPREVIIGPDVHAGQQPQFLVPANWWQGSSTDGAWSLVSTVVMPGFEWSDFVLGDRELLAGLVGEPADRAIGDRILQLTRPDPQL